MGNECLFRINDIFYVNSKYFYEMLCKIRNLFFKINPRKSKKRSCRGSETKGQNEIATWFTHTNLRSAKVLGVVCCCLWNK